jgi:hypothetical protein
MRRLKHIPILAGFRTSRFQGASFPNGSCEIKGTFGCSLRNARTAASHCVQLKTRASNTRLSLHFQSRISLLATMSRNLRFRASRHLFGRKAESQAWSSASWARLAGRPPWRQISRLTVEAARSSRRAISRSGESEAIPREMSSRSASVSASRERRRAAGAMPPRGNNTERMQLCGLSKARPISCSDCPAFHRLQTSRFSIAESPNGCPGLIYAPESSTGRHLQKYCVQRDGKAHLFHQRLLFRRRCREMADRRVKKRGPAN